uniref:Histidine kinase/HSP90-like ATPase domain-containing protein n=1 Tax=Pseudofrankia asymbiotica TaxID=1834516 RepID=A0A1V2I1R5_9ACTN
MSGVRAAVAPAVTRLPVTPAAVPVVRARTVQTLRQWSIDPDAISTAELVVSELVTNAVRASQPGDEFIAVRLSARNDLVAVEVWSRPDATELHARHPCEESESGRGLAIVEAVATRWDAYRAESGGVVVWAQFPGSVVAEPGAFSDAMVLPTREVQPVPEVVPAPARLPGSPVIEYSTDPVIVARVAERLRALHPWHERPATYLDESALTAMIGTAHGQNPV